MTIFYCLLSTFTFKVKSSTTVSTTSSAISSTTRSITSSTDSELLPSTTSLVVTTTTTIIGLKGMHQVRFLVKLLLYLLQYLIRFRPDYIVKESLSCYKPSFKLILVRSIIQCQISILIFKFISNSFTFYKLNSMFTFRIGYLKLSLLFILFRIAISSLFVLGLRLVLLLLERFVFGGFTIGGLLSGV